MTTEEMRRLVEALDERDLERLMVAVDDEREERHRMALVQVRRSLALATLDSMTMLLRTKVVVPSLSSVAPLC